MKYDEFDQYLLQGEKLCPKYPSDFLMNGKFGQFGMKALPNGSLLLSILSPF